VSDRSALALPPVEAVDALPPEALPGFIIRLSALLAAAGARLAVSGGNGTALAPTNHTPECNDVLSDVREVARIVRHSVSWVRKRGHTLPGFRQPGGKGCKVSWSRQALEVWVTSPTA